MPLQVLFWNRQQHHPLPLQAAPPCGTFTAPSSHAEGTSQQMGARPLQPKTLVLNSKPLPEEGCVIYKVRSGVQGCNQRVLSRWRKEMHGCRSPESTQLLPTSPPTPVPLPCRLGGGLLCWSQPPSALCLGFPPQDGPAPAGVVARGTLTAFMCGGIFEAMLVSALCSDDSL